LPPSLSQWKETFGDRLSQRTRAVARGLLLAVPLLIVFGGLLVAADAVKAAAKSLGDKNNYGWTTSIEWGGNAAGTVQGKTERGGATLLSMSRGDQSIEQC
jgi:hypothetical protein